MWALESDFLGSNPRCSLGQIHLLNLSFIICKTGWTFIYLLELFLVEIESILYIVRIQQTLLMVVKGCTVLPINARGIQRE